VDGITNVISINKRYTSLLKDLVLEEAEETTMKQNISSQLRHKSSRPLGGLGANCYLVGKRLVFRLYRLSIAKTLIIIKKIKIKKNTFYGF
jgi:hypothetical protein